MGGPFDGQETPRLLHCPDFWHNQQLFINSFCARSIHLCDKAGGCDHLRFSFAGTFVTYRPLPATLSYQCAILSTWKPVLRRSRRRLSRAEPEDGVLPSTLPSVFGYPERLQSPTHAGAPSSLPRTFWQELRDAPPLHLVEHLRQRWPGSLLIAQPQFPPSPGLLCLGQAQVHDRPRGRRVFHALHSAALHRGGSELE